MKTRYVKTRILSIVSLALFFSTACNVLDRPPLSVEDDETYWTSESKVRTYAVGFYPRYFVGYNTSYGTAYAPNVGYTFNDDMVLNGSQEGFEVAVPNSRGIAPSTPAETLSIIPWMVKYSGPDWYFGWIRRANIMLDRVETKMAGILTDEQQKHWKGVARFFRAMDYAQMVQVFGNVPYYDHEVSSADMDDLYKPRTSRNDVMDAVYEDLKFAMENVRPDDGVLTVNAYVVAGFASRLALFEGTWQKYHLNNTERAQKFLGLAVEAADMVMASGKYDIVTEFRALFTSNDLAGNRDVILYRKYGTDAKHSVASSCNLTEGRYTNPNIALAKSFICSDGSDWQTSDDANNRNFAMSNMIATRDPRFEATFYHKAIYRALSSYLYTAKFITREGSSSEGVSTPPEFAGANNVTAYPVMRYAEVLLNWIEAKAELATMGGAAVMPNDIDMSINKIRHRPIAAAATAMGVKQTADMDLANLPTSPDREGVSQLIWEIRRERRMEFAMEHSRLLDLKRWKKLEYMDQTLNPDILRGAWIDANAADLKDRLLVPAEVGKFAVTDMNGNVIVYNGANAAQMIGFYSPLNVKGRLPFLNMPGTNPYLAPVGINQQQDYLNKGYELKQTEGWPTGL